MTSGFRLAYDFIQWNTINKKQGERCLNSQGQDMIDDQLCGFKLVKSIEKLNNE